MKERMLRIICTAAHGRYKAGQFHPNGIKLWPADFFTAEQLEALKEEKPLIVEFVPAESESEPDPTESESEPDPAKSESEPDPTESESEPDPAPIRSPRRARRKSNAATT